MIKKTKKKSKMITVKKLDTLWSKAVRERDGYKCRVCGETDRKKIQAMHVIGRGEWAARWEILNGVAGCLKCHKYFTHRPMAWQMWIDANWLITYKLLKLHVALWYTNGCPKIDRAEVLSSLEAAMKSHKEWRGNK